MQSDHTDNGIRDVAYLSVEDLYQHGHGRANMNVESFNICNMITYNCIYAVISLRKIFEKLSLFNSFLRSYYVELFNTKCSNLECASWSCNIKDNQFKS